MQMHILLRLKQSIIFPWAIVFILLNLIVTQDGGPNATSRWVTMRSMAEQGTFNIDKRIGATMDWARTPDGHYYSNKAPGPMLLGFPVFLLVDQIPRIWEHGYRDENGLRSFPGYFEKTTVSFFLQIVPLILLVFLILQWMVERGQSSAAQLFFVLAVFFGNTAALYMNNYSGHAFEAILVLAILYSILAKKFYWAGFFAGAAQLSDYGFGMQIPALAVALLLSYNREQSFLKMGKSFLLGGIIPGALWIWYHTLCFGGPFAIANHFQNPVFIDSANETVNLWGIFHLPNFAAAGELLFGMKRGILATQPWVLVAMLTLFIPSKRTASIRVAGAFCVLSLAGLLFMNMSFGGWNGGGSPGPRYLSGIFPCFALWAALAIDRAPKYLSFLFWVSLGASLVFRALVFTDTILAGFSPLWSFYLDRLAVHGKTGYLRLGIFILLFAIASWFQLHRWQMGSRLKQEPAKAGF